jgi:hypothetical protein
MDDKSTPIESLNNRGDDSEAVNQILNKYNTLQDGSGMLPPLDNELPKMEKQFEDRNLNQEIYNLSSNDVNYQNHYKKELQRTQQYNPRGQHNDDEYEQQYEDEYEEYEIVQVPLWKKIVNQIRIPFFIFLSILFLFNCSFDKMLISRISFFGNQYNECNTYGFLLKSFIVSIISYLLIAFIRV